MATSAASAAGTGAARFSLQRFAGKVDKGLSSTLGTAYRTGVALYFLAAQGAFKNMTCHVQDLTFPER